MTFAKCVQQSFAGIRQSRYHEISSSKINHTIFRAKSQIWQDLRNVYRQAMKGFIKDDGFSKAERTADHI
jgi:hypothetical protein